MIVALIIFGIVLWVFACLAQKESIESRAYRQHEALREGLKKVIRVLDTYQVPWYAVCGTALGSVRHQDIIPWDDDIDIAVMKDTLMKIPPHAWRDAGLEYSPIKFFFGYKIKLRNVPVEIDIFELEPDPDQVSGKGVRYASARARAIWPREFLEEAPSWPHKGPKGQLGSNLEVNLPNDTQVYLKRAYGEDCLEVGKRGGLLHGVSFFENALYFVNPFIQRTFKF